MKQRFCQTLSSGLSICSEKNALFGIGAIATYPFSAESPQFVETEENTMDFAIGLNMEQEFRMEVYRSEIKHLTREQAQEYLLEVLRQAMVKDNVIKQLVKQA